MDKSKNKHNLTGKSKPEIPQSIQWRDNRRNKKAIDAKSLANTLSSSGFPVMFRSAEYISAEKHCGVSKCTDKFPSLVSTVNHAGMLTCENKT